MKKLAINIIAGLLIIFSSSCVKDHWIKGQGSDVTNTRIVSGFDRVELSIDADVELIRDSVFRIELTGQQNILDVVTTSVNGNTLDIDLKKHTAIRKHNLIRVKVYMPSLSSMDISGSGDISSVGHFTTENLNVNISGSGNITFQGNVNNTVTANISGSGDIQLMSNNTSLNGKYTISGSGRIDAEWMRANTVEANISGSGDLIVHALNQLNARISGSGDVSYRGNPGVSVNISGSGKLKQIQ